MKVFVTVKRVVDYKVPVRVKADGKAVETSNVKMSMNPFDEIAVEEAIRLKEKNIVSEIIAISIGHEACQETLRTALAMGADRGILVKTADEVQPLHAAKILKALIQQENPQLVILGKQAIDTDHNQAGQMLAGLLSWPQGTFASKIEFHDGGVSVTREVDTGHETLFLQLPAVVTTDLRLNEPRYISLPNIVQAKRKSITEIPLEALNIPIKKTVQTLQVAMPEKRHACVRVESVAELVDKLKNVARVI